MNRFLHLLNLLNPQALRALLAGLALGLVLLAGALVTTCHTRQPQELSPRQRRAARAALATARQQARRDSTLAVLHADSAAFYRRQQHALSPTSAADTTALRRFFADYFHW